MAGTAKAASDDLLTCERCHGFVAVEAGGDGKAPRVRCNNCGHTKELTPSKMPPAMTEAAKDAKEKEKPVEKWTVISPDGKVMTFGSWEELAAARPSLVPGEPAAAATKAQSGIEKAEPKAEPSASALLDLTPTPKGPKLALVDESDTNVGELVAKAKQELASAKGDKQPSVAELDSSSLVEDNADDEPAPISLRDAIVEDEEEPAPISLRDAIVEDEDADPNAETVSLKDLQVVAPGSAVDSTPPPPPRGVLKTLPPTPPRNSIAMPPPTITVEDPKPDSVRPAAKTEAKDEKAKETSKPKDGEKAAKKADAKDAPSKKDEKSASKAKKDDDAKDEGSARPDKQVASARAAVAEPEQKRGWVLPAVVVGVAVVVIWRMMSASKPEPPAPQPTPTATETVAATGTPESKESVPAPDDTAATTTTPPADTATATSSSTDPPSTATSSTTASTTSTATSTTTATEKKPAETSETTSTAEKKPVAAAESMSELLDRAGSARRNGDYTTARELYQRVLRQNPNNVEANGGLGDVARAMGDLQAAKASYERALATSPAYGPAQLGLADVEWDLGNRAAAQRRYAQIVERLGSRAPERAKQRAASE